MKKVILIDDEKNALEMLEWQLQTYCPQLQVAALCRSVDESIAAIDQVKPQLIFLDIEMPYKNGFDLLQHYTNPVFDIIFTTAFDQFAVKAFRFAALDYLLKPIDADDLKKAIERFEKKETQHQFKDQLEILLNQYKQPAALAEKVPFATQDGIFFIRPQDIVRCESSSNYTTLHFCDKNKLVISKTLKEVEEVLAPYGFYRVHHSHLINRHLLQRYIKTEGGCIELTDGSQVPVSRQRKDDILKLLLNG